MKAHDWRLTPSAATSLLEIVNWTQDTFGLRQADTYRDQLLDRLDALIDGRVPSRGCDILTGSAGDSTMQFVPAGQHFVIFQLNGDWLDILDFIHSRADLPGRVNRRSTNPEEP